MKFYNEPTTAERTAEILKRAATEHAAHGQPALDHYDIKAEGQAPARKFHLYFVYTDGSTVYFAPHSAR